MWQQEVYFLLYKINYNTFEFHYSILKQPLLQPPHQPPAPSKKKKKKAKHYKYSAKILFLKSHNIHFNVLILDSNIRVFQIFKNNFFEEHERTKYKISKHQVEKWIIAMLLIPYCKVFRASPSTLTTNLNFFLCAEHYPSLL